MRYKTTNFDLLKQMLAAHKGDSCLEFKKWVNEHGYGRVLIGGKGYFAHRVAYALTFGQIPEGLHVCHKCDNPPCVSPSHLFLGTQGDNIHDCVAKGRNAIGTMLPQAKLTAEKAREIRRRCAAGNSHEKTAAEFSVSRKTVSKIISGMTWKWA